MDEITYRPIGLIHSPFTDPKGTPIQPTAARGLRGGVKYSPSMPGGSRTSRDFRTSSCRIIFTWPRRRPWR